MSYSEIYTRRNWQNEPDTSTPLDADNLNAMDAALKIIDTRVVNIGNDAIYPSDIENALCGQPTIDQTTGIITFPKKGGGSYTLDTLLEKVITNWTFDTATQSIILTLPDGSTQSIPLSSFITENEFIDTSNIAFTVANHQVQAVVKDHSIGDQQMVTSYKADCESAKEDAEDAAEDSADSAEDAEAWAVGQRGGVDVPSTDPTYHNNSKYWKDQAQAVVSNTFAGLTDTDISDPQNGQVPVYDSTTNKWENASIPAPDISGKADKVSGATNGNLASLDTNGNLADSGKATSDFALASSLGTAAAKDVPASGNASSAQVVMGNDTRLSDSRTPTAHNQAASTITAGTFAGRVQANATAAATLGNAQARDIYAGTSDMTAGTTALTTGTIYIVYE